MNSLIEVINRGDLNLLKKLISKNKLDLSLDNYHLIWLAYKLNRSDIISSLIQHHSIKTPQNPNFEILKIIIAHLIVEKDLKIIKNITKSTPTKSVTTKSVTTKSVTTKSRPTEKDRKEAEKMVDDFSIILTGVRSGEIILGIRTKSKGAFMTIFGDLVPPYERDLDKIRVFDDLWSKFLSKLISIEFFSKKSKEEREKWLFDNQSDKDIYIEDIPKLEVSIQQLGANDLSEKLPTDYLEYIGTGQKIRMDDLYNKFPRKPSSEGIGALKRHTLVFRRDIWRVISIYRMKKTFEGPVISVATGEVLNGFNASINQKIYIFDNFTKIWTKKARSKGYQSEVKQSVGFLLNNEVKPTNKEYIEMANNYHKKNQKDYDLITNTIDDFTAAAYKSLIQKIVRFRPLLVDFGEGVIYDSKYALAVAYTALLTNPGSFVPDIQRYVTGMESALKRLVVIAYEDSYFDVSNSNLILRITASAYLAQRIPGWKIDTKTFEDILVLLDMLMDTDKVFLHDFEQGEIMNRFIIKSKQHPLHSVSALMDEIRSFAGDLAMIRYEGKIIPQNKALTVRNSTRPKVMLLEHCIDQHWAPEVIYFYPPELVWKEASPGSKPFSKLITRLFSEVTGVNPRRPNGVYDPDFENRSFVKVTRTAQKLVRDSRRKITIPHPSLSSKDGIYNLNYELERGWISGMTGSINVMGRPSAIVTLHPEDPELLVAVQKPSRNMKTAFLTDMRESEVLKVVRNTLGRNGTGILLNKSSIPVSKLEGARLFYLKPKGALEKEYYILTKEKELVLWEDFRKGTIDIPWINDTPLTLDNTLSYSGPGIVRDADKKLKILLGDYNEQEIRKTIVYLSTATSEFEFPRIGRDGGGTKQAVDPSDIGAYQLLAKISLLYPSALNRKSKTTLKWVVLIIPLLWKIGDLLRIYLKSKKNKVDNGNWGNIGEKLDRIPWEHQVSGLNEMKKSQLSGRKGHFIYIPVGMGKTFLVMSYLQWLLETRQLSKYIIYTLPSSAITSVINEIKAYGFDINILVPLKTLPKSDTYRLSNGNPRSYVSYGKSANKPKPYTINLVEHDHLRRIGDDLLTFASESIFIIDEVHKALNDTQRTAVALKLSHLSTNFVAMTGTPIIDTNTYKLIWWLEQIVPFAVNEKNYWVAANGMVARKVSTGVIVDKKDIEVDFTPNEDKKYRNLVSPSLGGINSQPRSEDLQKAIKLCYQSVTRAMVDMTMKYIEKNRGVFLVANDSSHQQELFKELLNNNKLKEKDVFLITKDQLPRLPRMSNIFQYQLRNVLCGETKKVPHGTL